MPVARFSPLLPLFQSGKALTYNQVLKAWPGSEFHASYGRAMATVGGIYGELEALVAHGVLVTGKRGVRGTWKLAKR